jgi:osmoprotectant transport system ATP-binding protein
VNDPASLRAEDLSKRFGTAVALDHISITVPAGECLALIGESGSGKTTLLRSLNRMVEPDSGTVYVDERPTRDVDPVALRRRMGYVPQDGGLLPHWRVRRNVGLVPWLAGDHASGARADEALRLVGMDPAVYAERWPSELSGGQRQRVAIARALAARPGILLLDEPFGALDAITRAELHDMFLQLHAELGMTAVLVTHDIREAIVLADEIAVVHAGRVEQQTTPQLLLAAPATPYVAALLARAGVT